jgi:hypothetical protein
VYRITPCNISDQGGSCFYSLSMIPVSLFLNTWEDARVLDAACDLLTDRLVGSQWPVCVPDEAPSIGDRYFRNTQFFGQ